MELKIWDDTFKSKLCLAIWMRREELGDVNAARSVLDAIWPQFREEFLNTAKQWRDTAEIAAVYVENNELS